MMRMLWAALISCGLMAGLTQAGEEGIRWDIQPLMAGKASLTAPAYHVVRPLGATHRATGQNPLNEEQGLQ